MYSFQKKKGDELHKHISEFNKLVYDLANYGMQMNDEDKTIIMQTSVKSTHMHMFNTLLFGRYIIPVGQVKRALLSSYIMEVT